MRGIQNTEFQFSYNIIIANNQYVYSNMYIIPNIILKITEKKNTE